MKITSSPDSFVCVFACLFSAHLKYQANILGKSYNFIVTAIITVSHIHRIGCVMNAMAVSWSLSWWPIGNASAWRGAGTESNPCFPQSSYISGFK